MLFSSETSGEGATPATPSAALPSVQQVAVGGPQQSGKATPSSLTTPPVTPPATVAAGGGTASVGRAHTHTVSKTTPDLSAVASSGPAHKPSPSPSVRSSLAAGGTSLSSGGQTPAGREGTAKAYANTLVGTASHINTGETAVPSSTKTPPREKPPTQLTLKVSFSNVFIIVVFIQYLCCK